MEKRYDVVPNTGTWPSDQAVPTLITYWLQRGYRTHEDSRTRPKPRSVVETPDGFSAIVEAYNRGTYFDVTLTSSSPCIWENGTPNRSRARSWGRRSQRHGADRRATAAWSPALGTGGLMSGDGVGRETNLATLLAQVQGLNQRVQPMTEPSVRRSSHTWYHSTGWDKIGV